jgi:hypothetical protein
VGWASVRLTVDDLDLRYVASIHGAAPGVIAVTTFGVFSSTRKADDESVETPPEHLQTTKDAFRVVHSESMDAIETRWTDLEDLLDEGMALALSEFIRRL